VPLKAPLGNRFLGPNLPITNPEELQEFTQSQTVFPFPSPGKVLLSPHDRHRWIPRRVVEAPDGDRGERAGRQLLEVGRGLLVCFHNVELRAFPPGFRTTRARAHVDGVHAHAVWCGGSLVKGTSSFIGLNETGGKSERGRRGEDKQ
jgi:hypothetical protein